MPSTALVMPRNACSACPFPAPAEHLEGFPVVMSVCCRPSENAEEDPPRRRQGTVLPAANPRPTLSIAMRAGALAVALVTSACSSSGHGSGASSTTSPSTSSAPSATDTSTDSTTGGFQTCDLPDLNISVGQQSGTGASVPGQYDLQVILRNTGTVPCGMAGFPGVDLLGSGPSSSTVAYPVPRKHTRPPTVIVQPGQQTSFTLTYVAEDAEQMNAQGGAWGPTGIEITPPNTTSHTVIAWPGADGFALPPNSAYASANEYVSPIGE
jgi:hypothetical protein